MLRAHQLASARPGQLCHLAAQSTRPPGCGILAIGARPFLLLLGLLIFVVLVIIVVVRRGEAQRMAAASATPWPLALHIVSLVSCVTEHSTSCTIRQTDPHAEDMHALSARHPEL